MVFAAPVALLAYSRRFRQIAYENKQGFFNLAIGSFATVLALRNIRTTASLKESQQMYENKQAELNAIQEAVSSAEFGQALRVAAQSTDAAQQGDAMVAVVKAVLLDAKERAAAHLEMRPEARGPIMSMVHRVQRVFSSILPQTGEGGAEDADHGPDGSGAVHTEFKVPISAPAKPTDVVAGDGSVKGWR
ncbi:unnamed protein product [Symbiodinium sp. KB8]|nr:unnamed protein product [Symbiodinium sp. KB8]